MANYTNEIAHMMERLFVKILSQDKEGFFNKTLDYNVNLIDLLMMSKLYNKELRISSLVDQLEINRNLVNTTLSKLISDRIVAKRTDPDDGRGQLVGLTSHGKRVAESIFSHKQKELAFMLSDITINEEKAILKFLSKYVQYHTERYEVEDWADGDSS